MAMKLLLSLGAATAASAASSSTNAVAHFHSHSSGRAVSSPRFLEDGDGNNNGDSYAYLEDLTGYALRYSSCLRVKIPQDNDDDAVEGNTNFYNGAYRAQYAFYATFHVCGDGSGDGSQCYAGCDEGAVYAADAAGFLETTLEQRGEYCEACADACGDGRRLEEAAVDCDACADSCAAFYDYGDDGYDESDYVECQEGFVEDDMQLYYGPACSDGTLVVGVFYDEECTIKTGHDSPDFARSKFTATTAACVDCADGDYGGADACGDLYGDSFHCVDGSDRLGAQDDDANVCSAVKKSLTVIDYGGVKKRRKGAEHFVGVFFGILLLGLVGGFFFLTFTYFVRHRGEASKPMLSGEDVHGGGTLT